MRGPWDSESAQSGWGRHQGSWSPDPCRFENLPSVLLEGISCSAWSLVSNQCMNLEAGCVCVRPSVHPAPSLHIWSRRSCVLTPLVHNFLPQWLSFLSCPPSQHPALKGNGQRSRTPWPRANPRGLPGCAQCRKQQRKVLMQKNLKRCPRSSNLW